MNSLKKLNFCPVMYHNGVILYHKYDFLFILVFEVKYDPKHVLDRFCDSHFIQKLPLKNVSKQFFTS